MGLSLNVTVDSLQAGLGGRTRERRADMWRIRDSRVGAGRIKMRVSRDAQEEVS
jgi:hypothetical protein